MASIIQLKLVKNVEGDKKIIEEKCKELNFELVDENFDYGLNRDNKFKVRCLNCGKISTKSFVTLVKLSSRCKFCVKKKHNYHNSIEEVMPKIIKACEENNYVFLGFDGGKWKGCRKTKLLLKCKICGLEVSKNYDNLINKGCKCICFRNFKTHEHNVLNIDTVNKKIIEACKKHNFEFIKFCGDGVYHNNKTILELKCNNCDKIVYYNYNKFTHAKKIACKHCNKSYLESTLKNKLLKEKICFEEQKKFNWLKYKNKLSLDFYIPSKNIAIECQGIQHMRPVDFFGGEEAFIYQKKRDEQKLKLCNEHNVKMEYIYDVKEIEELIKRIK